MTDFAGHKYHTEIVPRRGLIRAVDLNGSTKDTYNMEELFGANWNDGQFYSFVADVAWHVQFSNASNSTIDTALKIGDDSDVGETTDNQTYLVPANTERRWLLGAADQFLHAQSASGGTLRIRRSSDGAL